MQAAVASGHICVTETACEILKSGGNAFDAIVGAGFASVVAEPALTSFGGGGFLLAVPKEHKPVLYDFFADTPGRGLDKNELEPHFLPITIYFPGSEQVFNVGHGSIAVPGTLRGLIYTHKALGRLPFKEILIPAMELSLEGVRLNNTQSYVLNLLKPIMTLTKSSQNIFAPDGEFLKEGDKYINSDLASFLETLSKNGDREFYEGEIAGSIVKDMWENGGLLTLKDFSAYRVIKRKPWIQTYREYQLLTNPPPAFGGLILSFALSMLERSMIEIPEFGSNLHLKGLITLMKQVHEEREKGNIDREFMAAGLLPNIETVRKAFGGTTHISVLDKEGNAASLSFSNGEGSGYIVPGTGIMLNNMLGEEDLHPEGFHASPPGVRVSSMMSPSVMMKDKKIQFVIGSGGSKRIWTSMLQVLSNIIDFKMDLNDAVETPRIHWDGNYVQIEPGFKSDVLTGIQKLWPANIWEVKNIYFGGAHVVSATGEGAGDSRRDGAAFIFQ